MHLMVLWLLLAAMIGTQGARAAEEGGAAQADSAAVEERGEAEEEEEEDKGPTFKELVKKYEKIEGLFTLYRNREDNAVYIAIRPEQFDKVHLCNITRTQGDGYFFDSASLISLGRGWGTFPFVFERVGKKVFFKHENVYYRAESDAAVHRAVERLSDSIMGVGTVEGQPHPETGAVLVDASSFFLQDIALIGFILGEFVDGASYGFDGENSYFGELANFPQNTEIPVVLHFSTGAPKMDVPTMPDNRSFQHTYHYSLSRLPDSDFEPRVADDRVGHFLTMYQDYTSVLKDDPYTRYVIRWHLEKAEPKFKLSPPKEPIVYWLENTVPVEYRAAVTEGILLWNKAFERIGIKDAIVVKQQPDDADWNAGDVRYSTVRWMVQPGQAYAVGPSRANPYTGEIFDADIRISADFIRYVHLEFTEFADPVGRSQRAIGDSISAALGLTGNPALGYCDMADGLAQQAAFGWNVLAARSASGGSVDEEEYIRQLIVELVAHEVGHTLGLRHNFKASTIHSIEELHDESVSRTEGLSSSVMDYNPVNIAPEGMQQGAYYQTALGPYDYWAIEYAYRTFDGESETSEVAALKKIARKGTSPDLPYGTDEDAFWWTQGIDPSAARWDMGDDPFAYYSNRLNLSRELWRNLEDTFEKKGARYQKLRRVFNWGFSPYWRDSHNLAKHIGGIYHHRDHVGDPDGRVPMVPVPADQQRRALALLVEHVFSADAFAWDAELLNKLAPERWWDFTGSVWRTQRIDMPIHNTVLGIQRDVLNRLYDGLLLARLQDLELRTAADEVFTMDELFVGLRQAIWSELNEGASVNSFRRNLQRVHLRILTDLVLRAGSAPEDARTLARADLKKLNERIESALGRGTMDAYTQAHLDETQARIEAALEAGLMRSL